MSKTIDTLVDDIYGVLNGKDGNYVEPDWSAFGTQYSTMFQQRFKHLFEESGNGSDPQGKGVRASNFGGPCERKLWFSVNRPEDSEPFDPSTRFKFLFGDALEILLIELARIAGHTVEGEQTELSIDGIVGHRDVVIDGVTVDVKSASTFSYKRFKNHLQPGDDKFGYIPQLGFYVTAGQDDPCVTDKDRGAFLAFDKQHGDICLDVHTFTEDDKQSVRKLVAERKAVAGGEMPSRSFSDKLDGESGNRILDLTCSYCSFKRACWPGLQQYNYKNGYDFKPRFFTYVAKKPKVEKGF